MYCSNTLFHEFFQGKWKQIFLELNMTLTLVSTKMCIKFASYLHQKSIIGIKYAFYALGLMLSQIAPSIEGAGSA